MLGTAEKKKTFVQGNSPTSFITIIDAITATGKYLDPGIIFKGKSLQGQYFSREFEKLVPNWHYTHSDNGWTFNEIACFWLEQVFLPQMDQLRLDEEGNVDEFRAILLILDGHKSHISVNSLTM